MRTTLTLDPDVVRLLQEEVHRARKPFKQVVNDAIRAGLAPTSRPRVVAAYRVKPHVAQLASGFDRGKLNALADELEDAAVVTKLGSSRAADRRRK